MVFSLLLTDEMPELALASDGSESASSECFEHGAGDILDIRKTRGAGRASGVSFANIFIREYEVIPGDNPSVSVGCPLSLGWDYESEFSVALDDYETARPRPRCFCELRTSSSYREEKLKSLGFSRMEIQEGTKVANVVRRNRIKTIESLRVSKVHELLSKAKRKVFGTVVKGNETANLKRSVSLDSLGTSVQKPRRSTSMNSLEATSTNP